MKCSKNAKKKKELQVLQLDIIVNPVTKKKLVLLLFCIAAKQYVIMNG